MTKFQLYTTIFLIGCLCGTLIAVCAISFNKIEPIKKEIFVQKEDYIVKEDSIVLSIGDENYGTRTNDGFTYAKNRKPETDHDIVAVL